MKKEKIRRGILKRVKKDKVLIDNTWYSYKFLPSISEQLGNVKVKYITKDNLLIHLRIDGRYVDRNC